MKEKIKKVLNIIPYLILLASFALIISLTYSLRNGETPTVFGRAIFIVVSPSMEDTIMVGDVILVDTTPDELNVGDIISFHNPDEPDIIITHRIVAIEEVEGNDLYTTKGDNNDYSFAWETNFSQDFIIGKFVCKSPLIGSIYQFIFASGFNMIFILIIGIFLIVGGMEIASIVKQLSMAKTQQLLEEKEKMIQEELEKLRNLKEEDE